MLSGTPPLCCLHLLTSTRCVVAMRNLVGATMFLARLDARQQEAVRGDSNVLLAEQEVAAGGRAVPPMSGMTGLPRTPAGAIRV